MNTLDPNDPTIEPQPWSRRAQDVAAVAWSGFLAACLGTFIFFAFFDPQLLADDLHPPKWLMNRMTGYAVGFFFFWFVATVAAALTAYLLESKPAPREDR